MFYQGPAQLPAQPLDAPAPGITNGWAKGTQEPWDNPTVLPTPPGWAFPTLHPQNYLKSSCPSPVASRASSCSLMPCLMSN